ncbi:hypothetical protein SAMN05216201_10976 [Pseudomonas linyingensis]|uniref:Uncharacterized protein n=1 Tax=Pseudomonas linyingensis TaxID=915471 RepID=A0A1H6ZA97_9PSED|nr:hypothetical protein [Pseudomonas linyingensis]SEJ46500.1 hypothetical protein SAMN05216201_10976 [Pseudomonas linyingensis]
MEPRVLFDKFAERIFQLSLLQGATKRLIDNEVRDLRRINVSEGDCISAQRFLYYRPSNGAPIAPLGREADVGQALVDCRIHKIKQYQWILAEAYEALEDFLEESYAAAAMRSPSVWWMSDFGDVVQEDVDKKDFQWLLGRARRKKDRPYSIIERFRASSENFARLEVEDARGVNYRVVLLLIEKFRHVIVHNNGCVDNLDEIVNKAFGKSGEEGKFKADFKAFFEGYLELHDGRNIVCLLETPLSQDNPLSRLGGYGDTLGNLLKLLVSFADLVTETVESFGQESS